jgi:hypothetical protein
MTPHSDGIFVTTHVSRDFLQSAALFKNDHLVVWEYVSNGLQYVDSRTSPVVQVKLDAAKKKISIKDNGRGMNAAGLKNFFVMHGENVDRKAGRAGRGMFGTGKSAAFGIARTLILTTVKDGKRTKVSLDRRDIESMSGGSDIPVKILENEVAVADANGTLVEIEGVHLKLDQKRVIAFVEKHLAHWPHNVTVRVNNHECQYTPPTSGRTDTFRPEGEMANTLGDCTLVLRVAAAPLSETDRGVSIFSKGVWLETTLAGAEGREMSNFIFGEIDIPALQEDKSPVAPFDMSRSMQLNPANDIVRAAFAFIGSKVEILRKDLVALDKRRRASEEAKRLARQADEIAKLINDDFSGFRTRVARVRAKARGPMDLGTSEPAGVSADDDFIFGNQEPAELVSPTGAPGGSGDDRPDGDGNKHMNPDVQPAADDQPKLGQSIGGQESRRRRPQGGFSIDFKEMGVDQDRAIYERDARQIVINLAHPQFKAALGAGTIEDATFRRLAYEVAFSEYAFALAFELESRNEYGEVTEALEDVRITINRVARRAASLYEAAR